MLIPARIYDVQTDRVGTHEATLRPIKHRDPWDLSRVTVGKPGKEAENRTFPQRDGSVSRPAHNPHGRLPFRRAVRVDACEICKIEHAP